MISQPAATHQPDVNTAGCQIRQQGSLSGNVYRVNARGRRSRWAEARPLDMRRHEHERAETGLVRRVAIYSDSVEGVLIDQLCQVNVRLRALVRLEGDTEFASDHPPPSFAIIDVQMPIIATAARRQSGLGKRGLCDS